MGKKTKTGKNRQDKFYHLAKEQGFRSRAAFKLVQLNKRHDFLSSAARGVLDLCAAPGGWMQIARKYMPVGSPCIGIDLVPIRPVLGCVSIMGDITSDSARNDIRRSLNQAGAGDEKVDAVLNDGSPNMGKAWLQDAYTQSELTLAALKMAADFLAPGGSFITKVFRSNDYNSLLFVMHQLFTRVEATKPSASRNESAEIYVMCLGFKAPKSIDSRLLNPKYVFKDMATEKDDGQDDKSKPDLFLSTVMKEMKKNKKNREGYRDGETTFFKKVSILEFCRTSRPVALIVSASQFSFEPRLMTELDVDEEEAKQAALLLENLDDTSSEFLHCCEDLKVLARREFKLLLKWRIAARKVLQSKNLLDSPEDLAESGNSQSEAEEDDEDDDDDESNKGEAEKDGDEELDEEMHKARSEALAVEKRKRRKVNKLRNALQRKMDMKIVLPDEETAATEATDDALFSLNTAKRAERHGNDMVDVSVDVANMIVEEDLKRREEEDGYEGDAEVVGTTIEGEKILRKLRHPSRMGDIETTKKETMDDVERELNRWYKLYLKHTKKDKNGVSLAESKERKRMTKRKALREAQKKREEENEIDGGDGEDENENGSVDLVLDSSESSGEENAEMDDDEEDNEVPVQSREAKLWFSQPVFEGVGLSSSEDEDAQDKNMNGASSDEENGNNYGSGEMNAERSFHLAARNEAEKLQMDKEKKNEGEDGFEVVAVEKDDKGQGKNVSSDDESDDSDSSFHSSDYDSDEKAEMMAIAKKMKQSKRMHEDVLNDGYHRYTFDDPGELPRWFADQDGEYRERRMPVKKEDVDEMKAYIKALAAAPTKKEAEAKARRRGRLEKKMEMMKTKANNIAEQQDVTVNSRMKAIEDLYKKAMRGGKGGGKKDKKKVYQVVRPNNGRMTVGKNVGKGRSGTKGVRVSLVDRRLKSDKRGIEKAQKRGKKGKK